VEKKTAEPEIIAYLRALKPPRSAESLWIRSAKRAKTDKEATGRALGNYREQRLQNPTSPQCQQTYLNKKVVKASAWQMGEGGWLVAGVP